MQHADEFFVIYTISTGEPGQLTANQWFRHSDLVTDFVMMILSQSEGLGKTALGIVKYAYDRSSPLIGAVWFAVSLFAVSLSRSVVVDPSTSSHLSYLTHSVKA